MAQLRSSLPPELSLQRACALFGVPRSSVYRSGQEPSAAASERAAARVRLRDHLEELCLTFPGYGYRRLVAQLRREGWTVGKAQVQAILQEESLQCQVKRSWVATTQSQHGYRRYPNLVPELQVTGINQLWVADLTYIRLRTQFVYLAVVLDSYSRRVVGWELADTLAAPLCVAALEHALVTRAPAPGWVHHSDQGVQYASTA
jgi:putative transposase